ncbi:lipopolysaccharide biosynthesis protein [Mucilaginibacter sp. RCC_168]|uniref:lipopolysaccharide biosynthesis protein n=1 Tax=Mucilaginibacter sp. RCC_168 TaxID=3239221 RepID=UPI003526090F
MSFSIKNNPKYAKVLHWGKLITITGSAQLIIQAIAFICGITIIRLLPIREYAFYTLANTTLGTMTMLSDGGITYGVMAEGGKVWQDKIKLGIVLNTGLNLRRKFATICILLGMPLLLILLIQHGASLLMSLLIIASLVPAFLVTLSGSLLEIVPKLHQNIVALQKIQVLNNIGRIISLYLTIFLFPFAGVAIFAAGVPQVWANIKLRRLTKQNAYAANNETDPIVKKRILNIVKRILPDAAYYSVSGQISIWLISFFGTTSSIAEIGALGRLATVLTILTVLFSTLVSPRFARLPYDTSVLLKRFVPILFSLFAISIVIVLTTFLLSHQILWVLGKNYHGLKKELVLMMISSCLTFISSVTFSVYSTKGWALNPLITIPISVSSIILGIFLINIHSLAGILELNIFTAITTTIIHIIYSFYKILNIKIVNEH